MRSKALEVVEERAEVIEERAAEVIEERAEVIEERLGAMLSNRLVDNQVKGPL